VSAAAFEARYRAEGDPWLTLSDPGERAKARAALAACGDGPFDAVCDLGAGLGVLAAALAPRSRRLVALDAAPTAVAAAAERLARWPHAEARLAVLPDGLPAERFDLVVASEILYYLPPDDLDETLRRLDRALVPGGRVVAVHWLGDATDLHHSADDVHDALAVRPRLTRIETTRAPTYRLDVLEAGP
jgi:predicted TPR repeat methyltransferase